MRERAARGTGRVEESVINCAPFDMAFLLTYVGGVGVPLLQQEPTICGIARVCVSYSRSLSLSRLCS